MATSGSDRVAEFLIGLGLDGAEVKGLFAGVKSQLKSDVVELQGIADKLDLFSAITSNLPKVSSALDKARAEVKKFREEVAAIKDAGAVPTKELTAQLAAAEKAAKAAGAELSKQTRTVNSLGIELSAAGVSTKNLSTEQTRLAAAVTKANAELAQQQSKDLLGFKSLSDVQPRINELNRAFATLKDSGKLSASEIATANELLQRRIAEVKGEVSTLGGGFTTTAGEARAAFSSIVAAAVGVVASVGTITAAVSSAIEAAQKFNRGIAEIGTITTLTKAQLDALGQGARDVARTIGFDVNEATRGLFELIRSGVPPDNALEVLRISAEAAKAGITDTTTAITVADQLISGFGVNVKDLGRALDVLAVGASNGGATLAEFAQAGGPLLNIARAAGISLEDLTATLSVMVDAGVDAGTAMGDLGKIISRLQTAEVRQKLHELGIEATGLADTFRQLAERGLSVDQILELGVASTKSAAGVAALTNNAASLPEVLDKVGNAAGANAEKLAKLGETAEERSKRFKAAVADFEISAGNAFGASSKLAAVGAAVLNAFNELPEAFKTTVLESGNFTLAAGAAAANLVGLIGPAEQAAAAVNEYAHSAAAATQETEKVAALVRAATADLGLFAAGLDRQSKALSEALARDLAGLEAAAKAQLDALDKSRAAQAESAAAALEIQTKLADDKLALIRKNEAEITKATETAIAARQLAAKGNAAEEVKVAREVTALRTAEIQRLLGVYQGLYAEQTRLAQAAATRLQTIEEARIGIQRGIEAEIRNIRISGLSGLDIYVERNREIDRLISEGRKAAATGDIELARQFFEQAKTEAGQLARAVSVTGAEVVSATQAQQGKVEALKRISDAVNDSFSKMGEAARTGAADAARQQDVLLKKIQQLQGDLTNLRATAEQDIQLSIAREISGIETARQQLDELTRPRVVPIIVQGPGGAAPVSSGATGEFARGGFVGREPHRFAEGGAVWKVPGIGDRDTVPALLREGSYVLRKSAVQQYFPGYATGGQILGGSNAALLRILTGIGLGGTSLVAPAAVTGASDLQSFVTPANVIAYAKAVLELLGGSPVAALVAQDIVSRIRYVGAHPGDSDALQQLLNSAAALGLNAGFADFYGKTAAPASVRPGLSFAAFVEMIRSGKIARPSALFAAGGAASDTVPALLTPGEFVFAPEAARAIGADVLSALNNRIMPRDLLAGLARAPAMPRGYASGGPVPGATIPRSGSASGGRGGDIIIHMNGVGDLTNPATVRRVARVIRDEIERRSQ